MHDKLKEIYDSLPRLECQRKCQACCSAILISKIEYRQILATGAFISVGDTSQTELSERMAWANISDFMGCLPRQGTLTCEMLTQFGKCRVYNDRPLVCRIWGCTKEFACPHGCKPEYWLTDADVRRLQERILKVQHDEEKQT